MNNHDLQSQFNKVSEEYDSQRQMLIPCYNDFYGVALENLVLDNDSPNILDLGAGTGLFSQLTLNKYPNASIELVDLSEQMLKIAEKRFAGIENIKICVADYTKYNAENKFDAIISSLSIHHLIDDEKEKLYKKIFNWLKPDGIFINAEQVLGHSLYFEKLYSLQWQSKVEATDLEKEAIASAYERVKLDKRTPLDTQLSWLKSAGFVHVDCLYKYYDFAVIYAKKS